MFNRQKSNSAETHEKAPSEAPSEQSRHSSAKQLLPRGSEGLLGSSHRPTVVSEEFTIRGDLESEGTLHVEGKVVGTVRASTIHVSRSGQIEGDIFCQYLNIKGSIKGNVSCDEISLSESAVLTGALKYRRISIGKGAQIACEMTLTD